MSTVKRTGILLVLALAATACRDSASRRPGPGRSASFPEIYRASTSDFSKTQIKVTPLLTTWAFTQGLRPTPTLVLSTPGGAPGTIAVRPEQVGGLDYRQDSWFLVRWEVPPSTFETLFGSMAGDGRFTSTTPPADPAFSVTIWRTVGGRSLQTEVFVDLEHMIAFAELLTDSAIDSEAYLWLLHWEMNV